MQSDLVNIFTGQAATKEQQRGTLDCHEIGRKRIQEYFESRIMKLPSVITPVRKEKLSTMGRKAKKRQAMKVRPNKLMVLALKAQLLKAERLHAAPDGIGQQYYVLPKALVDDNGFPRKSQKSLARRTLCARYEQVLTTKLPDQLLGNKPAIVVVMDGMFLLQTLPLAHHHTILDYYSSSPGGSSPCTPMLTMFTWSGITQAVRDPAPRMLSGADVMLLVVCLLAIIHAFLSHQNARPVMNGGS